MQKARQVLIRGNNVGQMMKVVGEEGTMMEDFLIYLKAEFFDAVYLQQNAFDKVDEFTPKERQQYVFDVVEKVLDKEFSFEGKDEARKFFQELRQSFINWNASEF